MVFWHVPLTHTFFFIPALFVHSSTSEEIKWHKVNIHIDAAHSGKTLFTFSTAGHSWPFATYFAVVSWKKEKSTFINQAALVVYYYYVSSNQAIEGIYCKQTSTRSFDRFCTVIVFNFAYTSQKDTHTRINTGACRSARTSKPVYCKISVRLQDRT